MSIQANIKKATVFASIGAGVLWERFSNPRATSTNTVPRDAESLTLEWLTEALCKNHPGAKVTGISLGEKVSGTTDRRAFTVTYNAAGQAADLPVDLFIKTASGFKTRLMATHCGTLVNEYEFYARIRHELPIEAPVTHWTGFDRTSSRLFLLMEDLSKTENAQMLNVESYISRARIENMLDLIAVYHAKFWNSPRLDTEFTWLPTPIQWMRRIDPLISYRERILVGLGRAHSVVPASLIARGSDIWRAFLAAMEVSSKPPFTYQHGDSHVGNWYVTGDGQSGLFDWQVCFKGGWGHDYCYTILTSLTVEDRRAWERDLLAYYLDRLKKHGVANPPTFDEAWLLYRQQLVYTLGGWLFTIGFGPMQPNMQPPKFCRLVLERAGSAIVDHDSLKSLGI